MIRASQPQSLSSSPSRRFAAFEVFPLCPIRVERAISQSTPHHIPAAPPHHDSTDAEQTQHRIARSVPRLALVSPVHLPRPCHARTTREKRTAASSPSSSPPPDFNPPSSFPCESSPLLSSSFRFHGPSHASLSLASDATPRLTRAPLLSFALSLSLDPSHQTKGRRKKRTGRRRR